VCIGRDSLLMTLRYRKRLDQSKGQQSTIAYFTVTAVQRNMMTMMTAYHLKGEMASAKKKKKKYFAQTKIRSVRSQAFEAL